MTNSGKANEICQLAEYTHDRVQCDIAYRAALQMAEWKDQQFKEYLEKKVIEESKGAFITNELRIFFLKDIINELFGE